MILLLATNNGVIIVKRVASNWQREYTGLSGNKVTSIVASESVILAGTQSGIFRSEDLGLSWNPANQGLTIPHIRWLAFHPEISNLVFAGTEPAGIYFSQNRGKSWQICPEVEDMRNKYHWSLPYSPEAGCVRGFAFWGKRAYAAVEVGGVLTSSDTGNYWKLSDGSGGYVAHWPAEGQVHADVHSVEVHAENANMVVAPTGGGLFYSIDSAKSWKQLYRCYCRATWLDASNPKHMIFGPADGVDRGGKIMETVDGGQTWQAASNGLVVPWPHTMVERFVQIGSTLFAVLSDGRMLSTTLPDLNWEYTLSDVNNINAVSGLSM